MRTTRGTITAHFDDRSVRWFAVLTHDDGSQEEVQIGGPINASTNSDDVAALFDWDYSDVSHDKDTVFVEITT